MKQMIKAPLEKMSGRPLKEMIRETRNLVDVFLLHFIFLVTGVKAEKGHFI